MTYKFLEYIKKRESDFLKQEVKNDDLIRIKDANQYYNDFKKQCNIPIVSSSNKFLIRQISEKEFIILKLFKKEITQGYLWWKKTIVKEEYKRVDKYGNKMIFRLGFNNLMDCVKYKSKEKAEKWIAEYNKYPIDYYC